MLIVGKLESKTAAMILLLILGVYTSSLSYLSQSWIDRSSDSVFPIISGILGVA
jgi:hypothetical protein